MNIYKIILVSLCTLIAGCIIGYTVAINSAPSNQSTLASLQIRTFATSYGALRIIKEKSDEEAINLLQAMMNSNIKEMLSLYPQASEHDKEMIFISLKGYKDYIKVKNNEISSLVNTAIEKHNK